VQPAQQGRPQHNSSKNLAYDLGLTNFHEEMPEQLSEGNEQQKEKKNSCQVRVGHEQWMQPARRLLCST
jgi:hypothetical protein